jgi:TrmH family RNA methyltransferase
MHAAEAMKHITSRDNASYKRLLRLSASARERKEADVIVLDGIHLVQSYLQQFGAASVQLFVRESAATHPEVEALSKGLDVAMLVDDGLLDRASSMQSPAPVVALAPRPAAKPTQRPADRFEVLLDDVQDPGNVGAIIRSAAAAGGAAVHLSSKCADPWSPKALRGGMGAQFAIPVEQHEDLASAAPTFGLRLIACGAQAERSVFESDLSGTLGIIIGGEGAGISQPLLRQAHQLLRIPMCEGIESLNAAAAAAVVCYERFRQTRLTKTEGACESFRGGVLKR